MKMISKIESYLDGTMNQAEKLEFVKLMAKDPALAREVEFHKEVNTAIFENDVHYFRESVTSIVRRNAPGNKKLYLSWIKFPLAAAIVLLIAVSIWQIFFTATGPELYASFYKPYESDISSRTVEVSTDKIQFSYLLYQQGDYEASYEILGNYLEENYSNPTARFYYGMNAMELGFNEQAIESLSEVESDPSTPFSLHARWYLALLYLKTDQPDKAISYITILAGGENLYSQQAAALLKGI